MKLLSTALKGVNVPELLRELKGLRELMGLRELSRLMVLRELRELLKLLTGEVFVIGAGTMLVLFFTLEV